MPLFIPSSTQALLLGGIGTHGSTGGLDDLDVGFGASSSGGGSARVRGNPDDSDDDDAIARLFSIGGLKRRRSSDSHHQDGGGGSVRCTFLVQDKQQGLLPPVCRACGALCVLDITAARPS